jgi:hypothetical protein
MEHGLVICQKEKHLGGKTSMSAPHERVGIWWANSKLGMARFGLKRRGRFSGTLRWPGHTIRIE